MLLITLLAGVALTALPVCALAADGSEFIPLPCYVVQPGDTLSAIAARFDVSLNQLRRSNKLNSDTIYPGEVLLIPVPVTNVSTAASRSNFSREDVMLLARIIYAEARGENFTGQVAVGAVVMNRLKHPEFPKTIREVITQRKEGVCQFSPVADGSFYLEPDETAIQAALQALLGRDPTGGALFFYNPRTATDTWIRRLPVKVRIGNHIFC